MAKNAMSTKDALTFMYAGVSGIRSCSVIDRSLSYSFVWFDICRW